MSFRTARVLFITPFYMLFEFFLLKYIFMLFGGLNDIYLLSMAVLIGLLHVCPMMVESRKSNVVTRFLSAVDGVWMWASVMLLIDIVFIYLTGIFIRMPEGVIIAFLAAVPLLGVYNYYRAHTLVVTEKTLELGNVESEMNIVHLSDVHFGSQRHDGIIKQIASKLKDLEKSCDLAIISGDLADGSSVVCPDDFAPFKEVEMPIIFTPGNHDFYPGIDSVLKACENAGITVLDNENMVYKNLNIYGLTYSFGKIETVGMDELKEKIRPDMVNILNYHVPYFWEEFSALGFDLQLSGHTHGGQFYPVVWIGNLLFKYNMGLFKNDCGKYLHVTTGVGSTDTPMRWGTDSELVVLKLKKG